MNKISLTNQTIFITSATGFMSANLVPELLHTQSPIHIVGLLCR